MPDTEAFTSNKAGTSDNALQQITPDVPNIDTSTAEEDVQSQTCHILRLPDELIDQILRMAHPMEAIAQQEDDFVFRDPPDMAMSAPPLVCRRFAQIATPIVYSALCLTFAGGNLYEDMMKQLARTLQAEPHLQRRCRLLDVQVAFTDVPGEWLSADSPEETAVGAGGLITGFTSTKFLRIWACDHDSMTQFMPRMLSFVGRDMVGLTSLCLAGPEWVASSRCDVAIAALCELNLPSLKKLRLDHMAWPDGWSGGSCAWADKLKDKCGQASFTTLELSGFAHQPEALQSLVGWARRLDVFRFDTCRDDWGEWVDRRPFRSDPLSLDIIFSALATHKDTLRVISISEASVWKEAAVFREVSALPTFERLEEVVVPPSSMGYDTDMIPQLLSPRLKTLTCVLPTPRWDHYYYGNWECVYWLQGTWLRALVDKITSTKSSVRKITVQYVHPAMDWEHCMLDGYLDWDLAPDLKPKYIFIRDYWRIDLDATEFSWDILPWLAEDLERDGIEMVYADPKKTTDKFWEQWLNVRATMDYRYQELTFRRRDTPLTSDS